MSREETDRKGTDGKETDSKEKDRKEKKIEPDRKRRNVRSRDRMSKAIKEAEKILKQYYGYDHFREGQIPVIEAVLEGRDVLELCRPEQEVGMLSGAGTYDERNYDRNLAADLTHERSGWNAEPDGCSCSFLK